MAFDGGDEIEGMMGLRIRGFLYVSEKSGSWIVFLACEETPCCYSGYWERAVVKAI